MTDPNRALDRALVRGLSWNAAARWSGQLVSWASTIIVVRLLTPGDYGIAAMAGVVFGLVNYLIDGGIGTAIVSRGETNPARLSQLTAATLMLGVLFGIASALLAIPVARFFGEPRLVPVILVVSTSYVYLNFKIVPLAVLQRDLRFKEIAWTHLVWVVTSAGVSLALAFAGMGSWALVLGSLVGASASALLTWLLAPQRPRWPVWAEIRDTIRFGNHMMVSRLAGYANENADSLVIGRVLGHQPLGSYRVAMEIGSMPIEKVAGIIQQVATPIFASLRGDRAPLRRYFMLLTEALSLIGWPLALGLSLVADLIVSVVLGPNWLAAVTPLRILGVAAAVRSVTPLIWSIVIVGGNSLLVMRISVVSAVALVMALLVGSRWGLAGVAAAWGVVITLTAVPGLRWVLRTLEMRFTAYLRAMRSAALAAAFMCVVVIGVRTYFLGEATEATKLGVLVLTGAAAYLGAAALLLRARVVQIARLLLGRWRPEAPSPSGPPGVP